MEHSVAKPAGVVVAVRVDGYVDGAERALRQLRDAGAVALDRGPGRWFDGRWVDFSPVAIREQIQPEPGTPQV